jgi:hypothetical protein
MSDVDCALVDCADVPPQSRVAKLNAAQQCVWADECVNNEDCVLASDRSACCACPAATPKSLLDGSSCLRAEGDTAEAPSECACSEPVFCGQCPAPQEPTCVIRDSYSLCQ